MAKRIAPKRTRVLTLDRLLDAALTLADRAGLESVTMRALAAELGGVTPMALYTYVADKEALLDAMRDHVFARIAPAPAPAPPVDWAETLEAIARGIHRVLREHPAWLPLVTRGGLPPRALDFVDRLASAMLAAGIALDAIVRAYMTVVSYAVGSVLFAGTMLAGGERSPLKQRVAFLKELAGRLPEGRYTTVGSLASAVDRLDFDDVFEAGLRSIVLGLRREQAARARPSRRRRTKRRRME